MGDGFSHDGLPGSPDHPERPLVHPETSDILEQWDLDRDGQTDVRLWLVSGPESAGYVQPEDVEATMIGNVALGLEDWRLLDSPADGARAALNAAAASLCGKPLLGLGGPDAVYANMLRTVGQRCTVVTSPLERDAVAACLLDGGAAVAVVPEDAWRQYAGEPPLPCAASGYRLLQVIGQDSANTVVNDYLRANGQAMRVNSDALTNLGGVLLEMYK